MVALWKCHLRATDPFRGHGSEDILQRIKPHKGFQDGNLLESGSHFISLAGMLEFQFSVEKAAKVQTQLRVGII